MKKLLFILPLIYLTACDMPKKFETMSDDTSELTKTTKRMADTTGDMAGKMTDTNGTMADMNKKMTATHETMTDMNGSLKKSNATTEKVAGLTEKMAELTESLRALGLHGQSALNRLNFLTEMKEAADVRRRMVLAAQYFDGFEFQYWRGKNEDTMEHREELADYAVNEFLNSASEYITDLKMSAPSIFPKSREDQILAALAVQMDTVDMHQEDVLKNRQDLKPMTMLSIIEDRLNAVFKAKKENTLASAPNSLKQFIPFAPIAIYLMKVRLNQLGMISLSQTSPIVKGIIAKGNGENPGWIKNGTSRDTGGLWKIEWDAKIKMATVGMTMMPWTLDSSTNADDLEFGLFYLDKALKTKEFLKNLGQDPQIDSTFVKHVGKGNLKESSDEDSRSRERRNQYFQLLKLFANDQVELTATAQK